MIRRKDCALEFHREGEILRVEPYGPGVIRVRASLDRIREENWTLLPAEDCAAYTEQTEQGARLLNDDLRVHHSSFHTLL